MACLTLIRLIQLGLPKFSSEPTVRTWTGRTGPTVLFSCGSVRLWAEYVRFSVLGFYAAARLGELTVRRLDNFSPTLHVTPAANLSNTRNREGDQMTVLHVPRTKTSIEGEDIYWAKQEGETEPVAALEHHRFRSLHKLCLPKS